MTDEKTLVMYTDGSCRYKPQSGGFGFRLVRFDAEGGQHPEDFTFPGVPGGNPTEMEIHACTKALEHALKLLDIDQFERIVVRTDSMFIVENHKRAMYVWRMNKWTKADGGPVVNASFWKAFNRAMKKVSDRLRILPQIEWVKGHDKDEHNRAVDKLARASSKEPTGFPISIITVRRKRSPHRVKPGCVKLYGQRLAINIITAQFLKVQRIYRYRYEVISKKDQAYQLVDFICSKHELRAGHRYLVTLSGAGSAPEIAMVHREYKKRQPKEAPGAMVVVKK